MRMKKSSVRMTMNKRTLEITQKVKFVFSCFVMISVIYQLLFLPAATILK